MHPEDKASYERGRADARAGRPRKMRAADFKDEIDRSFYQDGWEDQSLETFSKDMNQWLTMHYSVGGKDISYE